MCVLKCPGEWTRESRGAPITSGKNGPLAFSLGRDPGTLLTTPLQHGDEGHKRPWVLTRVLRPLVDLVWRVERTVDLRTG